MTAREVATSAQANTDGPEQARSEINRFGRGVPMAQCVDCSHLFDLDSSPHFDRCWECAERADAEAGESL